MKRQLSMALALVLLAFACAPALASDGELAMVAAGLHGNRECDYWIIKHRGKTQGQKFGSCQTPILRVYADLMGASAGGITGAEYAASIGPDNGPDAGYFLVEIPNPTATTILGSAFFPPDPTPRGLNISWNSCQTGDRVLLTTVLMISLQPCGPDVVPAGISFGGVQHSSPSNVFFRCPLFTLCDGPVFTKVCLGTDIVDCETQVPPFPIASKCSTSGSFEVNPAVEGTCTKVGKSDVAANSITSDETWSSVKNLYR